VRVKPGTQLDSGGVVDNWAGEVFSVGKEDGVCGVSLDAISLDSMSDAYLLEAMEQGDESVEYYFDPEVLEQATARSTEEENMAAIERLVDREAALIEAEEKKQLAKNEEWKAAFRKSSFYDRLADVEAENIDMALNTFLDFLYNYEGVLPGQWAPTHVKGVCLEWAPAKITAEPDDFKDYGNVVIAFLSFLGDAGHIDNAPDLIKAVEPVKDRIPVEAAKESNWGPAKSYMMKAKAQGYDLSSKEEVEAFMRRQQMEAFRQEQPASPAKDHFKGIGRNQKITVQYEDGTIKADIKFKKVEKDLRAGRCEIVEG